MTKWQPIETAPRDGTEILAGRGRAGTWECSVAAMHGRYWRLACPGGRSEDDEFYGPTHWMPLPEPPK